MGVPGKGIVGQLNGGRGVIKSDGRFGLFNSQGGSCNCCDPCFNSPPNPSSFYDEFDGQFWTSLGPLSGMLALDLSFNGTLRGTIQPDPPVFGQSSAQLRRVTRKGPAGSLSKIVIGFTILKVIGTSATLITAVHELGAGLISSGRYALRIFSRRTQGGAQGTTNSVTVYDHAGIVASIQNAVQDNVVYQAELDFITPVQHIVRLWVNGVLVHESAPRASYAGGSTFYCQMINNFNLILGNQNTYTEVDKVHSSIVSQ